MSAGNGRAVVSLERTSSASVATLGRLKKRDSNNQLINAGVLLMDADERKDKQVHTGKQGTNEPWSQPGGAQEQQPGQRKIDPRPRTNEDNKTA